MSLSKRRSARPNLPSGARHSLLSLILVLVFTGFGFALYNVCSNRQGQFEAKLEELDMVNDQLRALDVQNSRLREQVALLKTDDGVEEVAREKLGLVRPGELAYSVVPPPPPQFVAEEDIHLKYGKKEEREVDKDRGTIIRVLRHLFGGPQEKPQQTAS